MPRMKIIAIFLLGIMMLAGSAFANELTVAAAANLQSVLDELKTQFEKDTGIQLKTVVASSGKLTAQIENGAPFDIFMSANMSYPDRLFKEGLTVQSPKIYAYGVLVLWTLRPLDISKGMNLLVDPAVKKIAIASPQGAPYGQAAIQALQHQQFGTALDKKFVYGESIAQVNEFIALQAADIGLTSKSTVLSVNLNEKGTWVEVDPKTYQPIAQGVVILKYAVKDHLRAARKFYDFIFSKEAREAFKKYGYTVDE